MFVIVMRAIRQILASFLMVSFLIFKAFDGLVHFCPFPQTLPRFGDWRVTDWLYGEWSDLIYSSLLDSVTRTFVIAVCALQDVALH
ncbi:hypothetical protein T02_15110 [Trichinella nativa]|uniref:Uncharacterized protein n=1 Tax=Trichinella nativa TaxID=6335 RepID=A0A0V1L8F0_9BILA|nr:hypothetical protein T02_15110 [Trichinella nativa]